MGRASEIIGSGSLGADRGRIRGVLWPRITRNRVRLEEDGRGAWGVGGSPNNDSRRLAEGVGRLWVRTPVAHGLTPRWTSTETSGVRSSRGPIIGRSSGVGDPDPDKVRIGFTD